MDEATRTDRKVPADWQPGDCDPALTDLVRRAFPDPQEMEDLLFHREETRRVLAPVE